MSGSNLPPPPRQATASNILAVIGLMILMAGLVVGIVLSGDALDASSFTSTRAWLLPVLLAGIGAFLVGVILRFAAILGSIRLRLDSMRDHLPGLIQTRGSE